MSVERGAWKTYGERTVYDNPWVRLGLADVEAPNGQRWEFAEFVERFAREHNEPGTLGVRPCNGWFPAAARKGSHSAKSDLRWHVSWSTSSG